MNKVTEKYQNNLREDLLDPIEAAEYLNAALGDGSQEVFLMALKDVANAKLFFYSCLRGRDCKLL